jgi:hypothetical protein
MWRSLMSSLSRSKAAQRTSRPNPGRKSLFRPTLEVLEDRTAPAVLTVNFLGVGDQVIPDAAGELSLREALNVVNSGSTASLSSAEQRQVSGTLGHNDTIVFDPSIFGQTIHLLPGDIRPGGGAAAAELTITRSVNIIGPGSSLRTIDASNNGSNISRALDITGSHLRVSISGITITDGTADSSVPHPGQGGGIFDSSGELSLTDVVLINCAATGSAGTAQSPNGGSAQGGGLYFSGDRLTISNSTFTGDTATGGAGAVATVSGGNGGNGGAAQGGAIFVSAHHVLLQNATFTNNSAVGGAGGAANGGNGGRGGNGFGGALFTDSGKTTVKNCTFTGNQANGGAGGAAGADGAAGTVGAAGKGRGGAIFDANDHHIHGLGSDIFSGNSASTSANDVFQKFRGDGDAGDGHDHDHDHAHDHHEHSHGPVDDHGPGDD